MQAQVQARNKTPEQRLQEKRNSLFRMANRTLAGTSHAHFQAKSSLIFAFLLVGFALYWTSFSFERKMLTGVCILFVSYVAVNLSVAVRNRDEADKMEQYAKETDLYNISAVETMKGPDSRYYFHWLAFGASATAIGYVVWHIDMPQETRGFLAALIAMVLMQSFNVSKTIRDQNDADKWMKDYDSAESVADNRAA